jgi:ribonuclease P protein component
MQGLRHTFPKEHRLVGKKNIETLLFSGEAFFVHPYRIVFRIIDANSAGIDPVKIVVAIPKRKCKLAVQRNYLKRITREAYRLQQQLLLSVALKNQKQIQVMFQYTQSISINQEAAMKSLQKILVILQKKITTNA